MAAYSGTTRRSSKGSWSASSGAHSVVGRTRRRRAHPTVFLYRPSHMERPFLDPVAQLVHARLEPVPRRGGVTRRERPRVLVEVLDEPARQA